MAEARSNVYEGLFLFPSSATGNLREVVDHLNEIFARAEAEILAMSKWGERPLAYSIKNSKRGLYILTYFRAPATRMANIERDCNLSELVLRFLITRADHLTEEQMRATDARESLQTEMKLREERGESDDRGGREAEPVGATAGDESEGE
jgi:ribosomal protein S6